MKMRDFFRVGTLFCFAFVALAVKCGNVDDSDDVDDTDSSGDSDSDTAAVEDSDTVEGTDISGTKLVIHGRVVETGSSDGYSSPLEDVEVTAGIDLNGDGDLDDNETAQTSTDENGNYSLGVDVEEDDRVVVSFRGEGFASQFRTVTAGGEGDTLLNIGLNAVEEMTCLNGVCVGDGNQVRISNLPDDVSGSAAVFNPVTQAEAFPGGFEESEGRMLISGVFAAVQMLDADGEALIELSDPATLRMTLPLDTWSIVTDIEEDTDRIEVPLYAFDEDLGTWVRDGEGYLEDSTGEIIPESELEYIRDGSYEGMVVAVGEVSHFSYWNVDWPVESHGCVSGTVMDEHGNPLEGATVTVRGVTYNGASSPVTTDEDGLFCVPVMRSEGEDEDLDQDGTTGETQSVSVRVVYDGQVYDADLHNVDESPATCDDGACTDLGAIELSEKNLLTVSLCTITGTVTDLTGAPMADAAVYGYDGSLDSEEIATVCGDSFEDCTYYTFTDTDGSFTITSGMLGELTLWAMWSSTDDTDGSTKVRFGERWTSQCPTEEVKLVLDSGYDEYVLTVTADGDAVSWTPNIPVEYFYVMDSAVSDYKWAIFSDNILSGFSSGLTYGVVPDGAVQYIPEDGAPDALESGDILYLFSANGISEDGYAVYATGQGIVI